MLTKDCGTPSKKAGYDEIDAISGLLEGDDGSAIRKAAALGWMLAN